MVGTGHSTELWRPQKWWILETTKTSNPTACPLPHPVNAGGVCEYIDVGKKKEKDEEEATISFSQIDECQQKSKLRNRMRQKMALSRYAE